MDLLTYAHQGADLRIRFFAANEARILQAAAWLETALTGGGKVLAFGNGGSAADAQHLAGELVGRFRDNRAPLAAVALSTDPSVVTCIANDYGYEEIFARQIEALAKPGDIAWAISTSGNSPNVLAGARVAKAKGLKVIGLLGRDGGRLAELCDLPLVVGVKETYLVQEVHTAIMHAVCALLEENFARRG
ncbi:MAG: SIS domain-containing protein [Myxococcales bacterium]|nr:SIS domain-containing protein [Myxococcales bacterium]